MEKVKSNIAEYIPQRPPMIMIDDLVRADHSSATTTLRISEDNLFVDKGLFTEPGLIENMAQTAAALVGYQCKITKTAVPLGFIAAIKNWKLHKLPELNSEIETSVQVVNNVMDVTIVEGMVVQGAEKVCSCELRILVQPNSEAKK